jgi:cytochrome b561
LVGGHLLIALKHQLIDKDNILSGILPKFRR